MIYTFNTKDYLLYPIIKEHFELSDDEVYNEIMIGYEILLERLSKKGIDYTSLKGALIPNQDKDKYETCLIIDTSLMDTMFHGYDVFKKIIPLLDKRCTCSILHGEYIDIINKGNRSQLWLKTIMNEALARCNKSSFQSSEQYYIVYFNRLTGIQRWNIVENLLQYPWFTGFADLTYQSDFKTYLSSILTHAYIKCGNKIIGSHPIDFSDEENENLIGYPFEESGYNVLSINEESFGSFLNYKIESMFPDENDVSFSFNALFPKFDSLDNLKLQIDDKKWEKYLTNTQDGKGKLLETIGYSLTEKEVFRKEVISASCQIASDIYDAIDTVTDSDENKTDTANKLYEQLLEISYELEKLIFSDSVYQLATFETNKYIDNLLQTKYAMEAYEGNLEDCIDKALDDALRELSILAHAARKELDHIFELMDSFKNTYSELIEFFKRYHKKINQEIDNT